MKKPKYKYVGTITGRLKGIGSNLSSFPKTDKRFIPSKKKVWIQWSYPSSNE